MFELLSKKKAEPVQVASELSAGLGRKPKINRLRVWLADGEVISWSVTNWTSTERITPWREFYRWWFGRVSESYIMQWDCGETMIRRADIKRFSVEIIEAA